MADGSHEVSIVMPAFNAARFVEAAVQSVRAQTRTSYELIAVNDGSADGTGDILNRLASEPWPESAAMTVIDQDNRGLAAARNAGLRRARGKYVAFLDADDLWRPPLLQVLCDALNDNPDLDLVFPLYAHIDENGAMLGVESPAPAGDVTFADLLRNNPIHSDSGVVVRAEAASAVGGFDENLTGYIGLDYWLRLAARQTGRLKCVPRQLAQYRRHGGQITSDWRRMERNWKPVMKKAKAGWPDLVRPVEREAMARHYVYWSTIAYANGDYPAARRLAAQAWRADATAVIADSHAVIRTLACLASLLPRRLHERVRQGVNRVNMKRGIDLTK